MKIYYSLPRISSLEDFFSRFKEIGSGISVLGPVKEIGDGGYKIESEEFYLGGNEN